MSGRVIVESIKAGDAAIIGTLAADSSGTARLSLTTLRAWIRRQSDGLYFDFSDNTFKVAASVSSKYLTLTEVSAANDPGGYEASWNTALVTNATAGDVYLATLEETGANAHQVGIQIFSTRPIDQILTRALAGDAMTLTVPERAAINAAIVAAHGVALPADVAASTSTLGAAITSATSGLATATAVAQILALLSAGQFTAAVGSSPTVVRSTAAAATGAYDGLVLVVVGPSTVAARKITSYNNTNGAFTVSPALPFTPAAANVLYVLALPAGASPTDVTDGVTAVNTFTDTVHTLIQAQITSAVAPLALTTDVTTSQAAVLAAITAAVSPLATATEVAQLLSVLSAAQYTIAAGSTMTSVRTNAARPSGVYDGMVLLVKSGVDVVVRRIVSYSLTNGAFVVTPALPFTPAATDTAYVLALPAPSAAGDGMTIAAGALTSASIDPTAVTTLQAGLATAAALATAQAAINAIQGTGFTAGTDDLHSLHGLSAAAATGAALASALATSNANTSTVVGAAVSPLGTTAQVNAARDAVIAEVDAKAVEIEGGGFSSAASLVAIKNAIGAAATSSQLGSAATAIITAVNDNTTTATGAIPDAVEVKLAATHGAGQWDAVGGGGGTFDLDELMSAHTTPGTLGAFLAAQLNAAMSTRAQPSDITTAVGPLATTVQVAAARDAVIAKFCEILAAEQPVVAAGSTDQSVRTNSAKADDFYTGAVLLVVNAAGSAAQRISASFTANGVFDLEFPLPFTPAPGDRAYVLNVADIVAGLNLYEDQKTSNITSAITNAALPLQDLLAITGAKNKFKVVAGSSTTLVKTDVAQVASNGTTVYDGMTLVLISATGETIGRRIVSYNSIGGAFVVAPAMLATPYVDQVGYVVPTPAAARPGDQMTLTSAQETAIRALILSDGVPFAGANVATLAAVAAGTSAVNTHTDAVGAAINANTNTAAAAVNTHTDVGVAALTAAGTTNTTAINANTNTALAGLSGATAALQASLDNIAGASFGVGDDLHAIKLAITNLPVPPIPSAIATAFLNAAASGPPGSVGWSIKLTRQWSTYVPGTYMNRKMVIGQNFVITDDDGITPLATVPLVDISDGPITPGAGEPGKFG